MQVEVWWRWRYPQLQNKQLQAYPTNQKAVYNDNNKEGRSNNISDDDNEGNVNDVNKSNETAGKEQEAGCGGDSYVDSDTE